MKSIYYLKIIILVLMVHVMVFSAKSQSVEIGNVTAELGDTVLVPLNYTGMPELGSFTFFVVFDPTSLTFLTLENVIPEADGILANASYQPTCDTMAIGVIWSAWPGVNFPDGKIWDFKMVFNNTNASLTFCFVEVTDPEGNIIEVSSSDGGITVNPGLTHSEWNGTGNWTDEINWSNGIPGAITTAIINTGTVNIDASAVSNKLVINAGAELIIQPLKSLTVFDSVMIYGNFTIKSDETGTGSFINNGEISTTGTVLVERYIIAGEHVISPPVSNSQASVFPGAVIKKFNEPAQDWVTLNSSDQLGVSTGYKITTSASQVYNYAGNMNYGNFNPALSYTTSGLTNYPAGMNLCGNPYPSALSWSTGSWIKTNVHASVYTWDGSQFISWNGEIGGLLNGIIPEGQGFVVFSDNSSSVLEIPNDARIHSDQPFYGNEKLILNMVEFSLNGNGMKDKTFLQFKFEAGFGFDASYDAYKIAGSSDAPQLYTYTNDGIKTSINVIPDINTGIDTAVTIGYNAPVNGDYQIIFEVNTFFGGWDLYLLDKEIDSLQSLTSDSIYSFNSEQGTFNERFSLFFKKPSSTNELSASHTKIFASKGYLFIQLDDVVQDISLEVFSLDGRLVAISRVHNVKSFSMPLISLPQGIYIVRLQTGTKVLAGKIMLN
jgi:hypothetical protein